MSQYAIERNDRVTNIRLGSIVGGYYRPPSGLQANTWHRLMPQSDSGAKVSGDNRQLNIGTLRSDLRNADIIDWHVKVLTAGYEDHFVIENYDAVTGYAKMNASLHGGNIETHIDRLPASYDFVLYPELLNEFCINYMGTATDTLEIGYVAKDVLNPSATEVIKLTELSPGQLVTIRSRSIDKVFYRFPTFTTSAANDISWGEHYVA